MKIYSGEKKILSMYQQYKYIHPTRKIRTNFEIYIYIFKPEYLSTNLPSLAITQPNFCVVGKHRHEGKTKQGRNTESWAHGYRSVNSWHILVLGQRLTICPQLRQVLETNLSISRFSRACRRLCLRFPNPCMTLSSFSDLKLFLIQTLPKHRQKICFPSISQ